MLIALHRQVALTWRQLDDEWVAYDAASGRTLQLDGLRASILTLLEEGPHTQPQLLRQLAAAGADEPDGLGKRLDELLQELAHLGLIDCGDRGDRGDRGDHHARPDTPAA